MLPCGIKHLLDSCGRCSVQARPFDVADDGMTSLGARNRRVRQPKRSSRTGRCRESRWLDATVRLRSLVPIGQRRPRGASRRSSTTYHRRGRDVERVFGQDGRGRASGIGRSPCRPSWSPNAGAAGHLGKTVPVPRSRNGRESIAHIPTSVDGAIDWRADDCDAGRAQCSCASRAV